ncbi:MAG TPA: hypothetical protein VEW26_10810 [Allosphingosinicella sp.]|nr:hypothetical protein [Allosphingosinicella sp.]
MKAATIGAAILLTALPSAAAAGPQEDAVKAVIKAVKSGEDLSAAFPGAISQKEVESLRRVSKCAAVNLMRQAKGRYTVIWNCGSKGALGMEVMLVGANVTSVTTMEVFRRPYLEP